MRKQGLAISGVALSLAMATAFAAGSAQAAGACQDGEIVIKFSHVTNADKHPKGIAASLDGSGSWRSGSMTR